MSWLVLNDFGDGKSDMSLGAISVAKGERRDAFVWNATADNLDLVSMQGNGNDSIAPYFRFTDFQIDCHERRRVCEGGRSDQRGSKTWFAMFALVRSAHTPPRINKGSPHKLPNNTFYKPSKISSSRHRTRRCTKWKVWFFPWKECNQKFRP